MEAVKTYKTTTKVFSLNVKKMKSLLEPIFKTINHSTVLPILEDILVRRKDGLLYFSSTDLQNISTISIPDEGEDFICVFPGVEFKYLIKCAVADTLEVSLTGDEKNPFLSVSTGVFNLKLSSESWLEYPKIIEIENANTFTIDVKELLPYLEKAMLFVSKDDLRPSMTGVCFRDLDGSLTMAATDAHRLYWQSVCKTPKKLKGCSFIVPAKAINLIISAFRTEKAVTVDVSETNFGIRCENKYILTRLIDARYPDFTVVIPTDNPLTFSLNRKDFLSLLRLCSPFTNKSTSQISVDVYPDKIVLNGGDADFSLDFTCSLPLLSQTIDTFQKFTFGVNARFWIQALECSKEELTTVNHSMNPLKAMIFDDNILLMPLMLNQ